jgi:dihydrofolate reductase
MRRVRFSAAASLDGYIAGPNGEYDWIPEDPTVDFAGLFANIDTVLLGRRTYEVARGQGGMPWGPAMRVYVFSSTLRPEDHPGVTIVGRDAAATVSALRAEEGAGEIWLFGGGRLLASLVAAGQVDAVEVTVVPVMLGAGVPLFPAGAGRTAMKLVHSHVYPSGMVALRYAVTNVSVPMPREEAR